MENPGDIVMIEGEGRGGEEETSNKTVNKIPDKVKCYRCT